MALSLPVVYVLVPACAAVLAAALAVAAWSRRRAPGAAAFTVVLGAVTAWSLAYTLELLSTDVAGTLLWARVSYLGIVVVPVAWLRFAADYTGHARLSSWPVLAALSVVPAAVVGLVWTNSIHGLVWASTTPVRFGDVLLIQFEYGPAFWANTLYAYALFGIGVLLLLRAVRRGPARDRWRVGAVVVGSALPWVGSVVHALGLGPTPSLNLTHLGFVAGGGLLFWAFYHQRLLDPRGRFRERVFESTATGMVLLDAERTVVDMNPAAEAVLGVERAAALGRPLDALLPDESAVFTESGERLYNDEVVLPGDRRYAVDVSTMYSPRERRGVGQVVSFQETR